MSKPPAGSGTDSTAARTISSSEHHSAARLRAAGLEARQVEQVLNQPRQSCGLHFRHRGQLVARLVRERLRPESAHRRRDRGQRRAQVVRNRPQQRLLDDVAAPKRLRLNHLRLQLLSPLCRGDQCLERRHHPLPQSLEKRPIRIPGNEHRANAVAFHHQRNRPADADRYPPTSARPRRMTARRRPRCADPTPATSPRCSSRPAATAPSLPKGPPPDAAAPPPPPAREQAPPACS